MKKLTSLLLLAVVFLFSESFTGKGTSCPTPSYLFTIDAAPFEAKEVNNYSGQVTNNARTGSLTFTGAEVHDKAGHVYPSQIQIDYTLRGEALGDVNVEKVTYVYNGETYYMLPGTAFMSITKFKWSVDKKSFVINADFFCKVQRKWIIEEFVPMFAIRGQLQNLTVVSPAS